MRGEHPRVATKTSPLGGSSPHARGAHPRRARHARRRGIIPACAGSTRQKIVADICSWDHPRMRGEHRLQVCPVLVLWGSSPHARGAQIVRNISKPLSGIIPACAGSTEDAKADEIADWDHPRMRGEHRRSSLLLDRLTGSSPHARGAHALITAVTSAGGIIPACAGSTNGTYRTPRPSRDHPRMRGEHDGVWRRKEAYEGSSPHARGARHIDRRRLGVAGIIPACAGSTKRARTSTARSRDHPRMRGEHRSCLRPSQRA